MMRLVGLIGLTLAFSGPLWSGGGECPVIPVPEDRWGELEPVTILHDGSCWDFSSQPNADDPYFFDVVVENGWVFAAAGKGLAILDARSDPGNPIPMGPYAGYMYAPPRVPRWLQSDQKFYIFEVDVPVGVDDLVATASSMNGLIVWNTTDKSDPTVHYQDTKSGEVRSVVTLTIDGRHYAFTSTEGAAKAYDLTAAQALVSCEDQTSQGIANCPGVYLGAFGSQVTSVGGAGHFVVLASSTNGSEVWDVQDPSSPTLVLRGGPLGDVALWLDDDSEATMAAIAHDSLWIYDVSVVESVTCHQSPCWFPSPLSTFAPPEFLSELTVSHSSLGPIVWTSSGVPRASYVLDVRDGSSPRDISPPEYWDWYTQFDWYNPRGGAWLGHHAYQAGFSVFDVHRNAAVVFADGFERGDTSAWSAAQ